MINKVEVNLLIDRRRSTASCGFVGRMDQKSELLSEGILIMWSSRVLECGVIAPSIVIIIMSIFVE